ncbi:hypothetical protein HDU82_001448 [Entophlyctis luteolus]|nr:hypothetical protein HDU82_001448 [Entophlyctis luteolus]
MERSTPRLSVSFEALDSNYVLDKSTAPLFFLQKTQLSPAIDDTASDPVPSDCDDSSIDAYAAGHRINEPDLGADDDDDELLWKLGRTNDDDTWKRFSMVVSMISVADYLQEEMESVTEETASNKLTELDSVTEESSSKMQNLLENGEYNESPKPVDSIESSKNASLECNVHIDPEWRMWDVSLNAQNKVAAHGQDWELKNRRQTQVALMAAFLFLIVGGIAIIAAVVIRNSNRMRDSM